MECLGPTAKKIQNWFDESSTEIMQQLEDKRRTHRAHLDPKSTAKKETPRNTRGIIQLKLRQRRDSWLSNKADEILGFADNNDMVNFYDGLKEVVGPPPPDHHPSSVQMGQH